MMLRSSRCLASLEIIRAVDVRFELKEGSPIGMLKIQRTVELVEAVPT